ELETENVAVVSLYPGIVVTEKMQRLMDSGDYEEQVVWACHHFSSPTETPRFVGRAVAALAADVDVMRRTGKV
ncbi:unnamed protein product, partial [Discosporangium mesarthrocarpum]